MTSLTDYRPPYWLHLILQIFAYFLSHVDSIMLTYLQKVYSTIIFPVGKLPAVHLQNYSIWRRFTNYRLQGVAEFTNWKTKYGVRRSRWIWKPDLDSYSLVSSFTKRTQPCIHTIQPWVTLLCNCVRLQVLYYQVPSTYIYITI